MEKIKGAERDEALQELQTHLPHVLVDPEYRRPEEASTSNHNKSEQNRKRVKEKIKGARQILFWSDSQNKWIYEFATQAELLLDHTCSEARKHWRNCCFDLTCKKIDEFPEPVTKAEAFAAWANRYYSWKDCEIWWNQWTQAEMEPRKVDEESQERMKRRLKMNAR